MAFSAQSKYWKMIRTYEVLKRIYTNNGSRITTSESQDAAEDFFCTCYHFKDWLIKDKTLSFSKSEVEILINSSLHLKYAADFCNSFKHGGLDRTSRSGEPFHGTTPHFKIDLTPNGFIMTSRLDIVIGKGKMDALALATGCIEEWDAFLKAKGVVLVKK
jgi:hypothetical protein